MEVAMAAMSALLPKLGELLSQEYDLQKSAKQDLRYLQRELQSMNAALSTVAEVPRDELPVQDRLWADDVRELSQDIEDIVESFLVSAAGAMPPEDAGRFKVFSVKMASLYKMAKARRKITTAVKDIKDQVTEVANRDERYRGRGGGVIPAAATPGTTIDPLLSVLYNNQKIIGMDDARDELIEKLSGRDDVSKQQPKIVSIVGFGGLGKTTLAKAVYDQLHMKFDCAAFVAVSRNPDVKNVFKKLLFELDKDRHNSLNLAGLDERQLIDQLRESLGTKRYFIVIDDIWDTSAWETIKLAFMDSNCGSRIITTTRNMDVSKACCSFDDELIHKMKPVSEGDSKRLFYKRIFASETGCPPQLEEVSRDILKKCGGVPLAIITLASHLVSNQKIKPEDQWHDLLKSIGHGITNGGSMEQMKKILLISYYDLPSPLKTCLLYLSTFPEDYKIDRNRLIRRWIAEGFIQGDNLFELGNSYFNELVNRSMVQPVGENDEDGPEKCCVHDIMLDLICELASQENFVTIIDTIQVDTPVERKVRRLSIQKVNLTNTRLGTSSISQVRSLTIFSPAISKMLPLSRFEVLRVLDLEDCALDANDQLDLSCVGDLLHLRYLGLRNTRFSKIPMEIGKLLFLQTLDLQGMLSTGKLPASIVLLRNLMFLYINDSISLPVGYKNLKSLRELRRPYLTEDDDPEELGYLTELRVLIFYLDTWYPPKKLIILLESIGKLNKLQDLSIGTSARSIDLGDWVPSSRQLRSLRLVGWYEKMPRRISPLSLPLLSRLDIWVHQVRLEDIQILGSLPALHTLQLRSDEDTGTEEVHAEERSFMLSTDAFPHAVVCHFRNVLFAPYMFPRGAMPKVKILDFSLLASDILSNGDWDLCLRNLPSLGLVQIKLYGEEENSERYSEAKFYVERAKANHPNRPLTSVTRSRY